MGEKLVILSTERAMMSVSSILFRTHHKGCRTPLALASYENPPPKAVLRFDGTLVSVRGKNYIV